MSNQLVKIIADEDGEATYNDSWHLAQRRLGIVFYRPLAEQESVPFRAIISTRKR